MFLFHSGFQMLVLVFFVVVLSPFSRFGLNSFLTKQSAYGFQRIKVLTDPTRWFGRIKKNSVPPNPWIFFSGRSDQKSPGKDVFLNAYDACHHFIRFHHQIPTNKKVHRATNNDSWFFFRSQPRPHFVVKKSKKTHMDFHGKSALITCPNHPRDSLQPSMEIYIISAPKFSKWFFFPIPTKIIEHMFDPSYFPMAF